MQPQSQGESIKADTYEGMIFAPRLAFLRQTVGQAESGQRSAAGCRATRPKTQAGPTYRSRHSDMGAARRMRCRCGCGCRGRGRLRCVRSCVLVAVDALGAGRGGRRGEQASSQQLHRGWGGTAVCILAHPFRPSATEGAITCVTCVALQTRWHPLPRHVHTDPLPLPLASHWAL